MINASTLVVGAAVIVILMIAAYYTFRSARAGGCSECNRCGQCDSKSKSVNCHIEDPEKKSK